MLQWKVNSLRPCYLNQNDPVSLAFDWYGKLNLQIPNTESDWAQRSQLLIRKAIEITLTQEVYKPKPPKNLNRGPPIGTNYHNPYEQPAFIPHNPYVEPKEDEIARGSRSFVAEHPDVFLSSCIVQPREGRPYEKFVPRNPEAPFPEFFEDDVPVILPFVPANKEGFDRSVYPMPTYNDGRKPTSVLTERIVGHTSRPPCDPYAKPPAVNPKTGEPYVRFEYLQTMDGWIRKVDCFLARNAELLIPVKRNRKARR